MNLNSKEIFNRLLKLYKTDKMNELSVLLGFKENWGASTRKRNGIPFEACAKAAFEKNISMDYLVFGINNPDNMIYLNELRTSVTEGLFTLIQLDMLVPGKDVKISTMADAITSEITTNCDIETTSKDKKAI